MKILITGSEGQLGWELSRLGREKKWDLLETDLPELDITDISSIEKSIYAFRPELIINAAAYTNVDQSESESELSFSINRDGPSNLAHACKKEAIPLIHISTDYVFDGLKGSAYLETEPVTPLGVYGKSKEAGEKEIRIILPEHIIIRTSWLYGAHGLNFVKTMLRIGKEQDILRVVSDQYGSPTCAEDLAQAIIQIAIQIKANNNHLWGTYHYCNQGIISWHEFAENIFQIAQKYDTYKVSKVIPISTEEYPTAASRPAFSALDCSKIANKFNIKSLPWQESLEQTINKILSENNTGSP